MDESVLSEVAEALRDANSVMVITGAGMSADSGLPVYRGVGGLYDGQQTDDGVPIEVALSGPTFLANPGLTWKYLAQIGEACRGAKFNRGHEVLAEMEQHFSRFLVLTQNIDGFHRDAGSSNVIEIHGSMRRLFCTNCGRLATIQEVNGQALPPTCPECGGIIRPSVVLFDEMLPSDELDRLHRELQTPFDVLMTIGTSSIFPYIHQPVVWHRQMGRVTVEINPGESQVSSLVDFRIRQPAAVALDRLWKRVQGE